MMKNEIPSCDSYNQINMVLNKTYQNTYQELQPFQNLKQQVTPARDTHSFLPGKLPVSNIVKLV